MSTFMSLSMIYCCVSDVLLPFLSPEFTEFTWPAARVRGRSEGQTEKPLPHSLRGGQRDPELSQESRNPGSEVTLHSLAAGQMTNENN